MNIDQVKEFCLSQPGSESKEAGAPSNVLSFSVGSKKFAYFKTSEPEKWRFSIRTAPERFLELTDQAGIKPARYMHRFHWVSIVKVEAVEENYLKELIEWSYHKAFNSLSRKIQKSIIQE